MKYDPFGPWSRNRKIRWILLAAIIGLFFGPGLLYQLHPPHEDNLNDFFQDWSAARNVATGLPAYEYMDVAAKRHLGITLPDRSQLFWYIGVHPPTSILLFLPFQGLDYWQANQVWNLLSLAALAVSLALVIRGLGIHFPPWSLLPTVALLLVCNPLQQQIMEGQFNLVLLLLVVSAWQAERSGKPILAGSLLALATAIKLFPGFLFLYFVIRRQWRALIAGVVAFALLTLLTAAIVGVDAYRYFLTVSMGDAAYAGATWLNASLRGFWLKLFDPNEHQGHLLPLFRSPLLATLGTLLSWGAILAYLLPTLWRAKTVEERDLAFGLTITAMLLISPTTWDHYFLLLLLPLATVWIHLPARPQSRYPFLAIIAALWAPGLTLIDLFIPEGYYQGQAQPLHTLTLFSFQCYALLGLFVLGWQASRRLALTPKLPDQPETSSPPARKQKLP